MIDIILFCFTLGIAYGSFWLGAKYRTLSDMFGAFKGWLTKA